MVLSCHGCCSPSCDDAVQQLKFGQTRWTIQSLSIPWKVEYIHITKGENIVVETNSTWTIVTRRDQTHKPPRQHITPLTRGDQAEEDNRILSIIQSWASVASFLSLSLSLPLSSFSCWKDGEERGRVGLNVAVDVAINWNESVVDLTRSA